MKWRDITLLEWTEEEYLAIACDVCASIGEKEYDALQVPLPIVGAFNGRVVLMEMIALGARPIGCTHIVGNDYAYTGRILLEGLKEELQKAGFTSLEINGSSEENMPTKTTSVGVTMFGKISKEIMAKKKVNKEDLVLLLGRPLVGEDVLKNPEHIVSYEDISLLHTINGVKDILPIGSQGILFEAHEMAGIYNKKFVRDESVLADEWFHCSGGPATALLVAVSKEALSEVLGVREDAIVIGKFI